MKISFLESYNRVFNIKKLEKRVLQLNINQYQLVNRSNILHTGKSYNSYTWASKYHF